MTGQVAYLEYQDIDQFLSSEQGLDGDVVQLDRGRLHLRNWQCQLGDLQVSHFSTNRAVTFGYDFPGDWTSLFLTQTGGGNMCGIEIPPNTLTVIRPDREYDINLRAGYSDFQLSLPTRTIVEAGLLPESLLDPATPLERSHVRLEPEQAGSLWRRLTDLFHLNPERRGNAASNTDAVLSELGSAVNRSREKQSAAARQRRYRHLRRAREVISRHGNGYLTIEALADEVHTSRYTLNRAFQDVLGISPYQFLLRRRLCAARARLLRDPNTTISDIAADFGFASRSEFAGHYRRFFGELPSATES